MAQMKDVLLGDFRGKSTAGALLLFFLALVKAFGQDAKPFRPEKLAEMDATINQAITDKKCPGGVLWFEHQGQIYHKAYGNRAVVPEVEPMTVDTIFDAASLTKVVACTSAMMLLIERGPQFLKCRDIDLLDICEMRDLALRALQMFGDGSAQPDDGDLLDSVATGICGG